MIDREFVVACDFGGTSVRVGVAGEDGVIRRSTSSPTPLSPQGLVEAIAEMSARVVEDAGWELGRARALGVGVPAVVDPWTFEVGPCPNYPGLESFPLRSTLEARLGIRVFLENDANAAAVGERVSDGTMDDFILVIIGTGIGMGIVSGGRLLHGSRGAAGEIGFAAFESQAPTIGRPSGALYERVSGPAIERLADSYRALFPDTVLLPGARATDLLAAAESLDPLSLRVLTETAAHLSYALRTVVSVLDPSLVLLGGGIGSDARFVRAVSSRLDDPVRDSPRVRAAQLANEAGLFGAASIAWSRSMAG